MLRSVLTLVCLTLLSTTVRAKGDSWPDVMKSAGEARRAGAYQQAKELLTGALVLSKEFDKADFRRTETKVRLAGLLLELGAYARCEQLCNESIDALKEKEDTEHQLQIARAEGILTGLYLELGMADLADEHCTRGLTICKSLGKKADEDVAQFLALERRIWNLNSNEGNSGSGWRSLQILEKSYGKSDPRLIVALEALAGDCYSDWHPEYARRAGLIAEAAYGKHHPIYGRCLSTFATALRHTRYYEKSELVSNLAIKVLSQSLGPDHPQLSAAYRNLASVERERGHSDRAEAHYRKSIQLRFSTLTDAELCHFLDQFIESSKYSSFASFFSSDDNVSDVFLTEMTRRGGGVIQQFLVKKLETWRRRYLQVGRELENHEVDSQDESDFPENVAKQSKIRSRRERYARNLQFATALCRIQQKPDPLHIFIDGPNERTYKFPELPDLAVTIRNVDTEKREIGFTESGNYRSGRQRRWRIEVTDAAGKVLEPAPNTQTGPLIGGGWVNLTTLKPAEGWQTTLAMSRFVDTLEPGEYQVRVLYHNDLTILEWEFVDGLIVCRSDPIKLTVKRRAIETTKEQQLEVETLLKQLDDQQICRVIVGRYGEWAHEFINPKSEYGRLLTLGWPAVPTLIEELEREGQTPRRRAHLLAFLFSITGEIDPRETSALGNYSMLEQGWSLTFKREGSDSPNFSSGFTAGPSKHSAALDATAQTPLIKQWQHLKSNLQVTQSN